MNKILIIAIFTLIFSFNLVESRLNQETMQFQFGHFWNNVRNAVNHATQEVSNTANHFRKDVGQAVSSVDINNYKNLLEVAFAKSKPCAFCAALTQECDQCSIHGNQYVCDGCEAMKLLSVVPLDVNILAKTVEVGLNKALCNLC